MKTTIYQVCRTAGAVVFAVWMAGCANTYTGAKYETVNIGGKLYTRCSMAYPTGSAQSSVVRLTKTVPAQMAVGKEFDTVYEVANLTNGVLENVIVADTRPYKFHIVGMNPQGTVKEGEIEWVLPRMAARETRKIVMRGSAAEIGKISSCGTVRYNWELCATTNIIQPGVASNLQAPEVVSQCDPINLVYTARNTGSTTLPNVHVHHILPEGLVTAAGGTRDIKFFYGDMTPGQTAQKTVAVKATRSGTFPLEAATHPMNEEVEARAKAQVSVKAAVLAIKGASTGDSFIGRPATFSFTVSNTGDIAANNVVLSAPLAAGAQVNKSSGGSVDQRNNALVWNLGSIAPGQSKTAEMLVTAGSSGAIRQQATVSADCANPATAVAEASFKGLPALLLEVVDTQDPIGMGEATTYRIIVTNQGSAPDSNITVECELEDNLALVNSGGVTRGTVAGPKINFAPLATLNPRQQAIWTVDVKGAKAGDTRFRVSMKSAALGRSVDETESTTVY